jgi:hypothetical protein
MGTLEEALTDDVIRAYGAALYHDLLDTASLHRRLPELYEDAAAYPHHEAAFALTMLGHLTKQAREHATATRELIVSLEHLKLGLRGGYDRPAHWTPGLRAERGWHDDARDI